MARRRRYLFANPKPLTPARKKQARKRLEKARAARAAARDLVAQLVSKDAKQALAALRTARHAVWLAEGRLGIGRRRRRYRRFTPQLRARMKLRERLFLENEGAKITVRVTCSGEMAPAKEFLIKDIAWAFGGVCDGTGYSFVHERSDVFLAFVIEPSPASWSAQRVSLHAWHVYLQVRNACSALLSHVDGVVYLEVVRREAYFVDVSVP